MPGTLAESDVSYMRGDSVWRKTRKPSHKQWQANRGNICLCAFIWIWRYLWGGTFFLNLKWNISSLKWDWWWQKKSTNRCLSLWSNGAGKSWKEQSVLAIPLPRTPSRHGWAASSSQGVRLTSTDSDKKPALKPSQNRNWQSELLFCL